MRGLPRLRNVSARWSMIVVVLLCIARAAAYAPVQSPDSLAYIRMADNLRTHGCLSYSDPATGACEPAWGTQPPGYPLFLAAIRSFSTDPAVAVAMQVALFGLAAVWLARGVAPTRPWVASMVALATCASPLTFAWSRWILTETLAAASVMLVFGVLVRAIRLRRLPPVLTGSALAAAMLIRWDLIVLVIPVAIVAIAVQPAARALTSLALASMLAAMPYGALMIRASTRQLPLTPPSPLDQDLPQGLLGFWRATALDQRATVQLIWPVWSRDYPAVRQLDRGAVAAVVPDEQFHDLVTRLSRVPPGAAVPLGIDTAFAGSAARVTPRQAAGILATRAWRMWSRDDGQYWSGWQGTPGGTLAWERWRTAYRMALLALSLLAVAVWRGPLRVAAVAAGALAVARTAFLVSTPITMLETRLLTPMLPVLEAVSVVVAIMMVSRLAGATQASQNPFT